MDLFCCCGSERKIFCACLQIEFSEMVIEESRAGELVTADF